MKSALVLCSGGLDSVSAAFFVKKKLNYEKITVLFFNYGQRNYAMERKCSEQCAKELDAEFFELDLKQLGAISTSLLNSGEDYKHLKKEDLKNTREESDKWYVPSRNLIFLSYAISFAESLMIKSSEIYDIFVGFKNEGTEPFLDATATFVEAMNRVSEVSSKGKFKIIAPLIEKDKEDIVNLARGLGVDFAKTFSCYVGMEKHCGTCLACRLRQQGFYWAGVEDPTEYLSSD
ncbi:MAG: 7-cyano-7-deazaguanine synthase [Nanoarchaeota archaeon]|nr:7-cyano-7-deazaguanine synthase [Nanoarchaeota archaeon]MBU0977082.1 7-cyano-7-deazaguanine synthase [Nanoarchaeota archaeon]